MLFLMCSQQCQTIKYTAVNFIVCYIEHVWPGGIVVRAVQGRSGFATLKVAGSTPGLALSGNNHGQVVHTRASVTKQYNLVPIKGR